MEIDGDPSDAGWQGAAIDVFWEATARRQQR